MRIKRYLNGILNNEIIFVLKVDILLSLFGGLNQLGIMKAISHGLTKSHFLFAVKKCIYCNFIYYNLYSIYNFIYYKKK